ncbi:lysophospholipid acyltransferase family protein [Terriglobus roseus]|uniref:lysophospholipid acyltransferase family protein n=1 Tax=Terriglobus roseus TaxID=392734 RepID=UPI001FDF9E49|nr:lysophospholipid acyltransferase family protein [Terriglobus roseus]
MSLTQSSTGKTVTARQRLEYAAVLGAVSLLRFLPRGLARSLGAAIGGAAGALAGRLSGTGDRNLQLAFPKLSPAERSAVLRGTFRSLGWQLAEFCQMSKYTPEFVREHVMRYEGLENFLAAEARGKGVLVLTGHLGAWELSSFVHSLLGHPMGMVIRRLDNPLVDNMVNAIRCQHGNRVLHKDDFARGLISAMHKGETVGILMDTNMTPPQGVFVPFFGVPACTASGLARVARKTGAAVVPGFLLWSEEENRYVLHFGEELKLQHTADNEADALANTALFVATTEAYIRRFPEQWLWLHRRWKTRPPGEPPIYGRAANVGPAKADTDDKMLGISTETR